MLYIIMCIGDIAFLSALIRFIVDVQKPRHEEKKEHYYQQDPHFN